MRMTALWSFTLLLTTLGTGWSMQAHATTTLYWTTKGGCGSEISRSNPGVSYVIPILPSGHASPEGIAIDSSAGKMYWADPGLGWIRRANTDGTGLEDLITSGLSAPSAIALDVGSGKMYWTDLTLDRIQRADLDGSNIETLVTTIGVDYARGIAINTTSGKIYWTDAATGKIRRSKLNGTQIQTVVTTLYSPREISLDLGNGKMYWVENTGPTGTGKIRRANLDGSAVEDLVTNLDRPVGIAVDTDSGHVYWSMVQAPNIRRAELDGSNPESLLVECGIAGLAIGDVPDPDPGPGPAVPGIGPSGTVVLFGVLGACAILYIRNYRKATEPA